MPKPYCRTRFSLPAQLQALDDARGAFIGAQRMSGGARGHLGQPGRRAGVEQGAARRARALGIGLLSGGYGTEELERAVERILALRATLEGGTFYSGRVESTMKIGIGHTAQPGHQSAVRAWAPHGADRFYELVTSGYYDDSAIFRIRPKTWAQFGINGNPAVTAAWNKIDLKDDPPTKQSNQRAFVTYGMYGGMGDLFDRATADGFRFPESLDGWVSAEWREFSQRRSAAGT